MTSTCSHLYEELNPGQWICKECGAEDPRHNFQMVEATGDCRCGEASAHASHIHRCLPPGESGESLQGDTWRCDCDRIWEMTADGWMPTEVTNGLCSTTWTTEPMGAGGRSTLYRSTLHPLWQIWDQPSGFELWHGSKWLGSFDSLDAAKERFKAGVSPA